MPPPPQLSAQGGQFVFVAGLNVPRECKTANPFSYGCFVKQRILLVTAACRSAVGRDAFTLPPAWSRIEVSSEEDGFALAMEKRLENEV